MVTLSQRLHYRNYDSARNKAATALLRAESRLGRLRAQWVRAGLWLVSRKAREAP